MARIIRIPDEAELPRGSVRDFVVFMFWLYMEAHRPTLRQISEAVRKGDYRGTASTETIRRILRGVTVPARWDTVQSVYLALCDLGGHPPYEEVYFDENKDTIERHVESRWHRALNFPDERYGRPAGIDSFSDEPPF